MRREDWPERLARYVRVRGGDEAQWVAGWLAECGGALGDEIDWRMARRGDLVELLVGLTAICVGQYAVAADGPLMSMSDAVRARTVPLQRPVLTACGRIDVEFLAARPFTPPRARLR